MSYAHGLEARDARLLPTAAAPGSGRDPRYVAHRSRAGGVIPANAAFAWSRPEAVRKGWANECRGRRSQPNACVLDRSAWGEAAALAASSAHRPAFVQSSSLPAAGPEAAKPMRMATDAVAVDLDAQVRLRSGSHAEAYRPNDDQAPLLDSTWPLLRGMTAAPPGASPDKFTAVEARDRAFGMPRPDPRE